MHFKINVIYIYIYIYISIKYTTKQFTVAIKKIISINSLRFKPNLKPFKKFEKAEIGN